MVATSSHSLKAHILVLVIIQLTWAHDYDDYDSNERYPMSKGVHVIDKGERKDGDSKLYSETLRQKGDSHGEDEYCYPQRGSTDQIKITEVEVKDEDGANGGGLAFEVSGGEGQGQVCFVLKSRHGKRYHYKVDIYGYRLINGVIVNENMAGGSFGTAGALGSGYGNAGAGNGAFGSGLANMGAGYGAVGGGLGNMGAGYGAVGSGLGNMGAGYGAVGNGAVGSGLGNMGTGYGAVGNGLGNTGAGYGAVGGGVGIAGSYGGVGSGRFGLNANNDQMGGSYGNPAGYGSGNPTGGYGSGFQQNGIGNAGYGQNQPYGSGNSWGQRGASRGPYTN